MDPNAALAAIRAMVNKFNEKATYEDMDELVEHIDALDEWLSRGGFLPASWDKRTIIWRLTPEELDALRKDLQGARTLRISVDWGDLKWKVNEDTWSPGAASAPIVVRTAPREDRNTAHE